MRSLRTFGNLRRRHCVPLHRPPERRKVSRGIQQSEWAESFDAQSFIARPVSTTAPILSPQTVPAMEQAIYAYEDLVARGGWPSVPADMELRIGVRDPRVVELRRRLIASGDLRQASGDPSAFDSYVQAAVEAVPATPRRSRRRRGRGDDASRRSTFRPLSGWRS